MAASPNSQPHSDPLSGRRLGNYRLDQVIGRGGMAQVYLGWDVKLERPVAVKVIDARYRHKSDYAQRFVREARSVATWRHPHVVQIYYADDDDGLYYYAMEYVDGLNLEELLHQYRREGTLMPVEDVLNIGDAVARALDFAHEQGIVHRDVKPSNVMVARNGRVLLTDFGLAMDVDQGSLGEVFGSPHYMAPEQARHSAAAVPQSDLYSLGIILYEMLTGDPPFDDPAPAALALQHITTPPPSPRERNPALNEAVERVLLRALEKIPDVRFPSGAAMVEELGAAALSAGDVSSSSNGAAVSAPPGATPTARLTPALTVAERIARYREENPAPEVSAATRRGGTSHSRLWLLASLLLILFLIAGGGLIALASLGDETVNVTPTAVSTTAVLAAMETRPPPVVNLPDPTETPTPAPSRTPTATETPAASPTTPPTATILYPDGQLLRLLYDGRGFYLLNLSEEPVDVERLAFETVPEGSGVPAFRFDGAQWARFYSYVLPDSCNYIELYTPGTPKARPSICDRYNARQESIDPDNPIVFWHPAREARFFRVLWEEGEIGRCSLGDVRCDVFVP